MQIDDNAGDSLEDSQSGSLRFSSPQDALDFGRQCVEDGNCFLSTNRFDIVERYRQGEIVIQLNLGANGRDGYYDLLFGEVPC